MYHVTLTYLHVHDIQSAHADLDSAHPSGIAVWQFGHKQV